MGRVTKLRWLAVGVIVGITMSACATVAFPYHYYWLAGATFSGGKLIGPSESDDRDWSTCQPSTASPHPCTVMYTPEFESLQQDYTGCKIQLESCQKHCPKPAGP